MIIAKSYLYIPAIKEKYYENINLYDAEAIIFDIEDSVLLEKKDEARTLLLKFLSKTKIIGKKIFIRINSEPSQNKDDLKLINQIADKITGVFIPKIKTSKEINKLCQAIDNNKLLIIPLIETPESILNLEDIASNNFVKSLALGEIDLSHSLNINPKNGYKQMIPIRLFLNIVLAAYKKHAPIGPVWLNIEDDKGYKNHVEIIKNLGYSGVQLIHPSQIKLANEIFKHSEDEIIWAKFVLKKSNDSSTNTGSFKDKDNLMVDEAIIKRAKKIIEEFENN